MRKFPLILLIFLLLISLQNISAQRKSTKQKKAKPTIERFEPSVLIGGIINGSAVNLKIPEHPKSCRCAGLVFLQVIFDATTNKVESAVAVSGHPLLRIVSIKAVKESEFRIHDHFWRKNLKVLGFVVYRFGEVEGKSKEDLLLELNKFLIPYKKMDKTILPLAAYSFDQTMTEKLKTSPFVKNGKVEIKTQLSDTKPEILQKIKQIGFEQTRINQDLIIGKIAIQQLFELAEVTEVLQISLTNKPKATIISCGVCNQKAIYLPKPEFPDAAKSVRLSGRVVVQIMIDEKGNVETAKVISGHILFRASSERAALQAKFEPFKLSGKPVKVIATIVYFFSI